MQAVILAAGEGKRMHPLTHTRPKVMVPLAGKPILEHVLLEIKQAGISDFILIVGYFDQAIRDYFGRGEQWNVSISYMTQRKQLGTADAVKTAGSLINGSFLLVNGDAVVKAEDLKNIIATGENTMGLVELEDTTDMGVVEIEGEKVVRIHEKVDNPPSNLINAGAYLLTPEIFSAIADTPKSPRGEYELTDSLELLIEQGIPLRYAMIGTWINVTYPWDALQANEDILAEMESKNEGTIEDNVVIKGPVTIGQGTTIKAGSYIVGPVIVGENCDIGPNCYIRASTAIGDYCHIGASVEVKNSIIMSHSNVPHHNYVGDSIIGENCNLGAGTKVANLRLDKRNVLVSNIDTGRCKLGVIMGDRVQTGINSCLNVGCSIGNDSYIGPGIVASGTIRPRAKIF
ncbi:MAG: NTP transferase domain-containing protein [Chloroflexi bacterium]|nr:NTP transferase domain-containing protein [Chloroflexota bacterium]